MVLCMLMYCTAAAHVHRASACMEIYESENLCFVFVGVFARGIEWIDKISQVSCRHYPQKFNFKYIIQSSAYLFTAKQFLHPYVTCIVLLMCTLYPRAVLNSVVYIQLQCWWVKVLHILSTKLHFSAKRSAVWFVL